MNPFTPITSSVVPVPLKDIDTDQIIPAAYLTNVSRDGFGEGLFHNFRNQNPHFPLNLKQYQQRQILCTDSTFGCGSSREHAVWALMDWGFRVILAPSFADIFFGNSAKNGLLLITLPQAQINDILHQSASSCILTVDLLEERITLQSGDNIHFSYDPFRKECLLNGYDDLTYIQSHQAAIDTYAKKRDTELYYKTDKPNRPLAEAKTML